MFLLQNYFVFQNNRLHFWAIPLLYVKTLHFWVIKWCKINIFQYFCSKIIKTRWQTKKIISLRQTLLELSMKNNIRNWTYSFTRQKLYHALYTKACILSIITRKDSCMYQRILCSFVDTQQKR